jgi:excisionase family DNA binding protein
VAKIETAVEPRLLKVKAAAAYLSTSPWTVRQLGWHGKLPVVRLGRSVAFDKKDLDAFIERTKLGGRA